jgi:HK97 family phage major capsid protein
MDPEIKTALDGLGSTVAGYHTDTKRVLAEMDKLKGLPDQLDALRTEFTERTDQIEVTLKRAPRGGLDKPTDEQKEAGAFFRLMKGQKEPPALPTNTEDNDSVRRFLDYKKALLRYIVVGDGKLMDAEREVLAMGEAKAMSVINEADGGYFAPPEMSSRILTRVFETSPMRSIASVISIGTDAIEFPTDTNDAVTGGWVGEKDSRGETATPQIGEQRISVHELYAEPRVTQKLVDDANINIEEWLGNKIGDKIARTQNTAFVSGNGEAKPRGFLDYSGAAVTTDDDTRDWGVLQYVATGAAGAFDTSTVDATAAPADELIDLKSKLKAVYRPGASWLMNRATASVVEKIKDKDGNYVWRAGLVEGQPDRLLGFPVVTAEDMPDIAANSYSIAFGNFREGYQIVDRQGIRILRDPFTAKTFIKLYTTARTGGDLVNSDAIKLLKFAAS